MAVIENHPIKTTVNTALNYGMSDKVAERKNDDVMKRILHEDIEGSNLSIYKTFTTTLNLTEPGRAYHSFRRNMDLYGRKELTEGNSRTKDGKPILAWHYIQSFEGRVDAVTANEIGVRLAEKMFDGFPIQISTHTDKDNTHNHIIICAWANDGHKWNQDNKTYKAIREESDRLCDEYGLSVIEHTRKQKLVEWTDSKGVKHYYEPTDRKNDMLEKRKRGEISSDDVRSYRNYDAYREKSDKEDSLTKQIRKDIDRLLPYAMDYEHLLRMLRESGYKIRDKKKNGDWLAHVTFTPPGAGVESRGKRDYALSKQDGYYTRENLTRIISENIENRRATHGEDLAVPIQDPVVMGQYEYGDIDLSRLDENYRTERDKDGKCDVFPRGEIERDLIRDTKNIDLEIHADLIDTSDLDRAIREQRQRNKDGSRKPVESKRERLVREIQENLDNLSFIERNKVYTYQQANAIISGLWEKQKACVFALEEAKQALSGYDTMLSFPARLEALNKRIRESAGIPEYMQGMDYKKDLQMARTLEAAISKYRLDTNDGVDKFAQMKRQREQSVSSLVGQLEKITQTISEYQQCMEVLRRIDSKHGFGRAEFFHAYDTIINPQDERERENVSQTEEMKKYRKTGEERE